MYRVKEVGEEKRWPDEGLYSGKKKETQNKRVRQRRQSETWGVHLFQQCILCLRNYLALLGTIFRLRMIL